LLLLSPVAMGQTKVDLTTQVKSSVMTTNTVPKWTGSTGLANGCVLDDGTHAVRCDNGFDVNSLGAYIFWAPNNASTGTTANKMACDDGAGKAIICPSASSTTNNPLGVAVAANGATPGTTGSTGICIIGFCSVIMDNSATAGHYAQSSSTVNGDLSDVGATIPTNGQSYWYIFTGNSGAGTAAIFRNLTPSELNSSSVSGGNGKSIQLQVNGTAVTKPIANFSSTAWTTSNSGNTTTIVPHVNHGISFSIGVPGGTALTVASTTTDYISVPFACTINRYTLQIDAGTITVKFWKVALGTAIPTSSNSINTSGVGISSGTAVTSTSLGDFTTTSVAANDSIAMNVTAVATAAFVNGVLSCQE